MVAGAGKYRWYLEAGDPGMQLSARQCPGTGPLRDGPARMSVGCGSETRQWAPS